ncbi:MAG: RagB/SusD family nutrient uptake outer membrane protein, partial [Tannerella sp.]|nr:RagB/SusD family nutrient uptake outer membrane protein [Tannerella sp.]
MKKININTLKNTVKTVCCCVCMLAGNACNNYLDIVPEDGLATLDNAFAMRSEAEKYLYTCYSYMPKDGDVTLDPSILGGDELWSTYNLSFHLFSDVMFRIALGLQNAASPLANYWTSTYQGLRVCNIFLENVGAVPDLPLWERIQWEGEANFIKAYYHFYLLRMYGPIPLVKENLSIDAKSEDIRVSRDPVDDCVNYIVSLLDTAMTQLPDKVINPTREQGRATKLIAAALKAKVLVFAASPLFNGNNDQATLANRDGTKLFNPNSDISKWERAATACKEALDLCPPEVTLFKYTSATVLSDTIKQELTIRNTFTEKWNSEIIWANTQTREGASSVLQKQASAPLDNN